MSYVRTPADVRVTVKGSRLDPEGSLKPVQAMFVAPDLSPVQPHLQIGVSRVGWTATDVRVESVKSDHRPLGLVARHTGELTAGKYVPSRSRRAITKDVTGPTASYKAMRDKAAALAARNERDGR